MKIAISGTHCVGKTTTIEALAAALKAQGFRVEVVKESARECPFPINEAAGPGTQMWLACYQLAKEIEAAQRKPDFVLCDRALPDIFAYYLYLLESAPMKEFALKSGEYSMLEGIVSRWIFTYDRIFYVRAENIPLVADGVRSMSQEFRDFVDSRMAEFYGDRPNCKPLAGATSERVQAILQAIQGLPSRSLRVPAFERPVQA